MLLAQIVGRKVETVTDFIFLDSKITGDSDYSHDSKRHLLLGRKNYDKPRQHIKCRHITLLRKVHLVKAKFFPVLLCKCESCTIKKAEH